MKNDMTNSNKPFTENGESIRAASDCNWKGPSTKPTACSQKHETIKSASSTSQYRSK